jgi:ABC-type branched-subunit amino acid transport system substrate-binding protein
MNYVYLILTIWAAVHAQPKEDKKATALFESGKAHFEKKMYKRAAGEFNDAAARRFHRLTTPALYMAGLSYFYDQDYEKALHKFQSLLNTYPASIYAEEARYHKGLIMLKKSESYRGGLYVLLNLYEETGDPRLKEDVLNAVRHFFYEVATDEQLNEYWQIVRPAFRSELAEAVAFRLLSRGQTEELAKWLAQYKLEVGALSARLKKIEAAAFSPVEDEAEALRIAVVLPFRTDKKQSDRAIFVALEVMQGVMIAAEHLQAATRPAKSVKISIEFFDSKREPSVAAAKVQKEIKAFDPHYLVGDLFNGGTKAVAEALTKWKTPPMQIVPTSPAPDLTAAAPFVYLATPSLYTQADALAKYGVEKAMNKRWMLVGDGSKNAQILVARISAALKKMNAQVDSFSFKTIPTTPELTVFINKITDFEAEAVYFAFADEDILAPVVKEIVLSGHDVQIFGTPDWSQMQSLDPAVLAKHKTVYPDNLFPANDTVAFQRFKKTYEIYNHNTPSPYACLGYDILRYIYFIHENGGTPKPADERLKDLQPWKGLVQNYYFAAAQDNQAVQLIAVKRDGPEKILLWKE